MDAEMQGKSARPRPDLRSSPDSTVIDVKSEDEGKRTHQIVKTNHPKNCLICVILNFFFNFPYIRSIF